MNKKISSVINIALLMLVAYIVMIFISHFSVYHTQASYSILESFRAMLLKTDVPADFLLWFGGGVVLCVAFALLINVIFPKKQE